MNQNGFFRRELPGGAILVGDPVPGRRSAAVGVWFRVGSRDEPAGREGAAHFIEHLVFKGSRKRTGREIASALERVGGSLEAFTTKDTTCFYARVLEDHVGLALDVIGDMVSHPRFLPSDVDVERSVILDELRNAEDTPEDLIGDLVHQHLWPGDIMGASILGTRSSLRRLGPGDLAAFYRGEYAAPRVVVSAAGAIDPGSLERHCRRYLELPADPSPTRRHPPPTAEGTLALHELDLSQLYLVLAAVAPSDLDPARRPVQLLAEIFGGGMSSRLFQTIRERDGLAYSVQAYTEHFEDTGLFGVSLAVSPRRGREALTRTLEEMERLRRDGLAPGELEGAKAQIRGGLIMGQESLTSRMSRLARNEFRTGGERPIEATIEEFDRVTADEVLEAASRLLDPARASLIALGPTSVRDMGYKTFARVVETEGV